MQKYCIKCGAKLIENENFCPNCRTPIIVNYDFSKEEKNSTTEENYVSKGESLVNDYENKKVDNIDENVLLEDLNNSNGNEIFINKQNDHKKYSSIKILIVLIIVSAIIMTLLFLFNKDKGIENEQKEAETYIVKEKEFDDSIYAQYEIGQLKFIVPKEWNLDSGEETNDEENINADSNELIFRFPNNKDGHLLVEYTEHQQGTLYNEHDSIIESHVNIRKNSPLISNCEIIDCSEIECDFDIKCIKETLSNNGYKSHTISYFVFDDYSDYEYVFSFIYNEDKFDYLNQYLLDIMNSIYCIDSVPHDSPRNIEEENISSENNEQESSTKENNEESEETFINPEEIYNNNDIQISTNNIAYDKKNGQICIYYSVTNNSLKDIKLSIDTIDVNGYSLTASKGKNNFGSYSYDELIDEIVYKNMTLSSKICFNVSDLKYTNLEKIQYFKFYLNIFDFDYNNIDRKYVEIYTNQYGSYEEDYSFIGQTVYESKDYKCYVKPNSSSNIDNPLIIYVENNTSNTLTLTYNGFVINGESFGDTMLSSGIQVLPNSHYIGLVDFQNLYSFSNKQKPSKINSLSMYIGFVPTRSNGYMVSSDLFNSDGFTVTFN